MFRKSPARQAANSLQSIVGADTILTGNCEVTGSLRIEGVIDGDVVSAPGQSAVIEVTATATVTGNVVAPYVVVFGKVKGNVIASKRADLKKHAEVSGDVLHGSLKMASGVRVGGELVEKSARDFAAAYLARGNQGASPRLSQAGAPSNKAGFFDGAPTKSDTDPPKFE